MILAIIKNWLFPHSGPVQACRGANYGTVSKDTPEAGALLAHERAEADADADVDVEAQEASPKSPWKLNARVISDAIIGLSDGLTVPFALTAGLSSLGDTHVVVLGGLAELIAGAISMGLGGFIGAKSEAESYAASLAQTRLLIATSPTQTAALVASVFAPYLLSPDTIAAISDKLHSSPEQLLDFLMRFHHQQPEPDVSRPTVSAVTIATGYFVGGFVPLLPYFFVPRTDVLLALWWSIGIMVVALFTFGWVKTGVVCGWSGRGNVLAAVNSGGQMVVVGTLAAGAAIGLVRVINGG